MLPNNDRYFNVLVSEFKGEEDLRILVRSLGVKGRQRGGNVTGAVEQIIPLPIHALLVRNTRVGLDTVRTRASTRNPFCVYWGFFACLGRLTGVIPAAFGNLKLLRVLKLTGNKLEGE